MKMYRGILSGVLILFILSIFTRPVMAQNESASTSVSRSENGVHRWTNGLTDFNIEVRGKIDVTDDDKDIKSLSNDGYLKITKTVFGSKRAIIVESLGGGKFKKEYYEGRTKMEWEPNGKDWLGEILPEIVRTTTLASEGRVNRIFAKAGASGVLAELSRLEGDYTRAHYAKLLLEKNIPDSELPAVITKIADAVNSDYYLSTVLQNNVGRMLSSPQAAEAFFQGTKKIGSAYYKSVVLKEALKKYPASPSQVKMILQSAATIDSDYYLSVVLTTLLDQSDVKDESLNELIVVSKNISSDHYRTQVLKKALERPGISKVILKNMVDGLQGVGSDYYKTMVFNSMTDRSVLDADVQIQVIKLIEGSVSSDYYASSSLKNMLEHQKLTDESFKQLVATGGKLNSANYASDVLRTATKKDLSQNQLIDILNAAGNIDSDHYLTEVLMSIASQVRSADSNVKDAYRQAAKKIDSESYYGRALKAID